MMRLYLRRNACNIYYDIEEFSMNEHSVEFYVEDTYYCVAWQDLEAITVINCDKFKEIVTRKDYSKNEK